MSKKSDGNLKRLKFEEHIGEFFNFNSLGILKVENYINALNFQRFEYQTVSNSGA